MFRAARTFVIAAALAGCMPKPAALQKTLESPDPAERARAASALARIYADKPAELGDHGEAHWKDLLTRAIREPALLDQVAFAPVAHEGPGDPTSEEVRLDEFWTARLRYAKGDPNRMSHGPYQGFDPLERAVTWKHVVAPSGFVGTWTTFYVNGARRNVSECSVDRCDERDFYDDGKVQEERHTDRVKQHQMGMLIHYYPSGKKAYEDPYVNGKQHGLGRGWYPSGQLQYERPRESGEWEGNWKSYRENGELELCVIYRAGKEVSRGCE